MKNIVISALVAAPLLASPAFAQDKGVAKTDSPAIPMTAQPPGTAMSGGMVMANTATAKIKFVTAKPADVTSSKLVGKNLYNKQDESVGEIEDLVIENGKTISGVVVSVGGFLGIGERYVVVDPSSIFLHRMDGKLKAMVDTDKDALKNAPEFKYDKKNS
ncbi:PRC-barrel domain-containing protein [Methylobacterium sp. Leaf117]|uniref:PRC-barrel domain-containing protein n=1 Tax=Methylobacterium sp. Leaf117 TaxID=1736260 RepID=UPI0006FF6185|nr:PRC-barrel domain-containing protein [Methylobacterium sp. Leaf117]KQP80282.1 photosystem reaction center subunit H [Methylobacterium sp. Leaf117]